MTRKSNALPAHTDIDGSENIIDAKLCPISLASKKNGKMSKAIFSTLFFFLPVLANFSLDAGQNQLQLDFNNIDREYLKRFFYAFFLEDDFSYTLFGAKPMSFGGMYKKNPDSFAAIHSLVQIPQKLSLWHAIETFKKYRKSINKRYIFIFNEDESSLFIYFIDKENFIKKINSNIDIFLQELGENFTTENFVQELIDEKTSFLELIHHHEGILGILLGYGRHNSMLFQRKADILGRCWAYGNTVKKKDFLPTISPGFKSADEELSFLDEKLGSFSEESEYSGLMPVAPLGFAADSNHAETQALKQKYHYTRQSINEAYTKANPIDVIIEMLFQQ